jgi:hypothetical protein
LRSLCPVLEERERDLAGAVEGEKYSYSAFGGIEALSNTT